MVTLVVIVIFQRLEIIKLKKVIVNTMKSYAKLERDKELLVRETQHRVKNNMQVISSLLSIQDRNASNKYAKDALKRSKNRVKSIALIHQRLYEEEGLGHFSAQDYIKSLSSSVFNAYRVDKERVKLITDIDDLLLDIDTGIPVGLILNELLTNCLNYAFIESEVGEVIIRLKEIDKKLILELEDSGMILSHDELKERVGAFGTNMISTFRKKLDASLTLNSGETNKVSLHISNYKVKG
ncbi:MAG: sensor histidine kinase [Flavobacteriales bacterium]|nr:sensor histidine kinase [Flavobacteriales bacterium]